MTQEAQNGHLRTIVETLRHYPPETLAKHGITLAPERDWATELWAETFEIFGRSVEAKLIRRGTTRDERDKEVISLFRTRFEQMKRAL